MFMDVYGTLVGIDIPVQWILWVQLPCQILAGIAISFEAWITMRRRRLDELLSLKILTSNIISICMSQFHILYYI